MNEGQIEGVNQFLKEGFRLKQEEVPTPLGNTEFVREVLSDPNQCPKCDGPIKIIGRPEDSDGVFVTKCKKRREHIERTPREERIRYELSYETVFSCICELFGWEFLEFESRSTLPRYLIGHTAEDIDICLIHTENRYEKTIKEVFDQAIRREQVTLLLTPRSSVKEIFEITEVFAVGPLVCPVPFENLERPDSIKKSVINAKRSRDLTHQIEQQRGIEADSFLKKGDKNPLYIATELAYMRLLRENGELSVADGSRLEEICSAAFSHIATVLPGVGGEDDSGESLPDNIFRLPENEAKGYDPILALVDTKSGTDANFAKELIERKHRGYIERVQRQPSLRDHTVAHTFVVFDVDGHQEIEFYNAMRQYYDADTVMVVLTSEALAYIVAAYFSAVTANELELAEGEFTDVIRPFFSRDRFYEDLTTDDRRRTRLDVDSDYPDHLRDEYEQKYIEKEQLIVVTGDMVDSHFKNTIDTKGRIEHILEGYLLA